LVSQTFLERMCVCVCVCVGKRILRFFFFGGFALRRVVERETLMACLSRGRMRACVSVWRENRGSTYHRFVSLPEKLPQFWHWTVRFSWPDRRELNADIFISCRVPFARARGQQEEVTGRTVRAKGQTERHLGGVGG
jgi:hypothetical protein